KRTEWLDSLNATGGFMGVEKRGTGGSCSSSDCEKITLLVKLGHSCDDSVQGKVGHTGIAIGNDYYDYGPDGNVIGPFDKVPGKPWWDDPNHPVWGGGKASSSDIGLSDIISNLVGLTGGGYDVIRVQWC